MAQATSLGLTFIFHIVDAVTSDLDEVVNKLLVGEAKAMGATKVDLKYASTTPRHGIWAVFALPMFINLIGTPSSSAVGIAVK